MTGIFQALSSDRAAQIGAGLVVLVLVLAIWRVLAAYRRLRAGSREGRRASIRLSDQDLPLVSCNRAGRDGDPVNVEIVGTAAQVAAAFAAAGWYRADEIDLITSARIAADSVLARRYSTAPVSNLYLFGRKEDFAFERPGGNVRQRDHIRLWNTGRTAPAPDGRPLWIGGATRDVKVELSKTNHLPTHGISPDVDAERDLVVSELATTGFVVRDGTRPGFGQETNRANGGGDPYHTDGQVAVLVLANVPVLPTVTQVRGPLLGRLARFQARLFRWRLPHAGLERAAAERARRAAKQAEHAAARLERAVDAAEREKDERGARG